MKQKNEKREKENEPKWNPDFQGYHDCERPLKVRVEISD